MFQLGVTRMKYLQIILLLMILFSCSNNNKIVLKNFDKPGQHLIIENGSLTTIDSNYVYYNDTFSFNFPYYYAFSDSKRTDLFDNNNPLKLFLWSLDITTLGEDNIYTTTEKVKDRGKINKGIISKGKLIKISDTINANLYIDLKNDRNEEQFTYKITLCFFIGEMEYRIIFDGRFLVEEIVYANPEFFFEKEIGFNSNNIRFCMYPEMEELFKTSIYNNEGKGIAQDIFIDIINITDSITLIEEVN